MTPHTLVGTYQCCGGALWATILKMEAEISSETEVPFHQTTRASHTYKFAFFYNLYRPIKVFMIFSQFLLMNANQ
jgi:hypothetical protein